MDSMDRDAFDDSPELTDRQLNGLLRAADGDLLRYVLAGGEPADDLDAIADRAASLPAPTVRSALARTFTGALAKHAVAVIALRTDARALARVIARDRLLALELADALARDLVRALDRALALTRDLALALDPGEFAPDDSHEVARALARGGAAEIARDLGEAELVLAYDLARDFARGNAPARGSAHALARVQRLVSAVDAIPVDASAADLSDAEIDDVEALAGVVWTVNTIWPPGMEVQVRSHSEKIDRGVWRVRNGNETGWELTRAA